MIIRNTIIIILLLLVEGILLLLIVFKSPYWKSHSLHMYNQGIIEGQMQAALAIQREFGNTDSQTTYSVFTVKDKSIIAITINGVKTIREYKSD